MRPRWGRFPIFIALFNGYLTPLGSIPTAEGNPLSTIMGLVFKLETKEEIVATLFPNAEYPVHKSPYRGWG